MDFKSLLLFQGFWMGTAAFPDNVERLLIDTLLTNYSTLARPVLNPSDSVNVNLGMVLTSVNGVSEMDQSMTCSGIVKVSWIDPFLTWNQSEFSDVQHIYLSPSNIWIPDIVVLNSLVSVLEPIHTGKALLKVWSNGSVTWMPSGRFQTDCDMDITNFPFDVQNCTITLGTNAYQIEAVNITVRDEPRSAYRDTQTSIRGNNQWEVLGEELESLSTNSGTRQLVIANIHLKRRSRYFVINILFPSMVLAALNLVVCFIPHELSDKVGVSTTLFLAYIIFLLQITNSTPANSDTIPFVSVILLVLMSLSALDVIFCIILLRILRNGNSGPPPFWLLRGLCLGKKSVLLKNNVADVPSSFDFKQDGGLEMTEVSGQNSTQKSWQPLWRDVSHRLEKVVIIVQSVAVFTMFLSVPSIYLSSKEIEKKWN